MFRSASRRVIISWMVAVQLFTASMAINVTTIDDCPSLPPRASPPTSVKDLRIDDIKVIAAMGDSLMAGFGMDGIDEHAIVDLGAILEYRGESYGIGGDPGAVTIANFLKKYRPDSVGASQGNRLVSFCSGILCLKILQYHPEVDKLNSALSGALATNLEDELNYLIPQMKATPGIDFENDWKLITLQIGSNDQCSTCSLLGYDSTIEKYGSYVEAAILRIQKEIPRVIVNLLGTFKVSPVYTITQGQSYCRPLPGGGLLNQLECSCFKDASSRAYMDVISDGYNEKLKAIYEKYKAQQSDTFAVVYQPANIDVGTFPIDALSNLDCFHPSRKAHQWIAKTYWNTLFLPQSYKGGVITFQEDLQIYCPTENDRIMID